MRPIYLLDEYADTLLALGVSAAFGVEPEYTGTAYLFPDTCDNSPIKFPVSAGDADPEPPHTFHKFKLSAIAAMRGTHIMKFLEPQWNEMQPQYDEVMELFSIPYRNDWNQTRFLNVKNRRTGSSIFRPIGSKDIFTGQTLKEFWLTDALRAIGWLTYMQPKLFINEAAVSRWRLYVPCLPNVVFCDAMLRQPQLEVASRADLMAQTIGAELSIPQIRVVQYAEFNTFSRTAIRHYTLQPPSLSFEAAQQMKRVIYAMSYYAMPQQHRWCEGLLAVMVDPVVNVGVLARIVQQMNMEMTIDGHSGAWFTSLVDELISTRPIWNQYHD